MKEIIYCFLAGGLGMLVMFLLICLTPEIEDFLTRKKK
jgi:hypothetical protein